MSEIRVDTISEKTSASGTTVSNLKNPNQPFRNIIINGDMRIAQRATSATTISNLTYQTIDRLGGMEFSDGTATLEQHSMSAADEATTGQKFAALWKCTGTDSSIAADQYAGVYHYVEAQNLQHLNYGTSSAKDLTLSFWVKSNTTGTYSIGMGKSDSTTYYIALTYTINSADTWEKKVINISPTAGSTSLITGANGGINNDNGVGFTIFIYTALGTNYHTASPNTWSASAIYGTSDQPNLMSSTSNNWYITGLQLEVGSTATDFEHLPFDVEFHRCQRYCQQHTSTATDYYGYGVGHAANGDLNVSHMQLHPNMRTAPTLETSSTAGDFAIYSHDTGVDACTALPVINGTGDTGSGGVRLQFTAAGDQTASGVHENLSNNAVTFLRFTAEL